MSNTKHIAPIFSKFETGCEFREAENFTGGLINQSWLVTADQGPVQQRFLLQKMNSRVFLKPDLVMRNITLVTNHLLQGTPPEPTLEFVPLGAPAEADHYLWRDETGSCWRLCRFIENTRIAARLTGPADAETAGQAYGRFLTRLADMPARQLHETIPGFHDTPARWAGCLQAYFEDSHDRISEVGTEMEILLAHAEMAKGLAVIDLPRRVVHNDAKLANVLLDAATGQAVCVVDLDTVMPGSALHDFGDMMRTMCCLADEEETDLNRVAVDQELFAALARGYLGEAGQVLTPVEKDNLVMSGLVIIFEQAVRFLTDYLLGDIYYQTSRRGQNLDRCRNQLRLLESVAEQYRDLEDLLG